MFVDKLSLSLDSFLTSDYLSTTIVYTSGEPLKSIFVKFSTWFWDYECSLCYYSRIIIIKWKAQTTSFSNERHLFKRRQPRPNLTLENNFYKIKRIVHSLKITEQTIFYEDILRRWYKFCTDYSNIIIVQCLSLFLVMFSKIHLALNTLYLYIFQN